MAKRLNLWHQKFIFLQVIALCAVSLKLLLNSLSEVHTLSAINYDPKQIDGWQNIATHVLTEAEINQIIPGYFQDGMKQTLTQQAFTLTLQRATISQSNGDLKKYLKNYSDDLSSTLKYHADIGHYSVFTQDDHLTMMACLTASHRATVTADQFKVAQIKASFSLTQLGQWFINQENLIPHTCQWRSLSLFPVTSDSTETLLAIWQTLDLEE
ncbi:hypothetical protein [[Leptolyngbya] sp. PCC 7376]|uniref:hypothetical protein n=1 Tax=[Leptolyngbya] sp. PCC 7376 TaxID=111781 RepID=UPI000318ABCC|nr:hypothetical protein [[Leptolyngbya] sp. PCC 7376]